MSEGRGPTGLMGPFVQECGACPYLPERSWRTLLLEGAELGGAMLGRLLAAGFRRSGRTVYVPWCGECHECIPIRVRVDLFRPTPDQRRSLRKNRDVDLEVGGPTLSDENLALYRKFLRARYPGRDEQVTAESYAQFFVHDLGQAQEFRYTVRGRLVGVGIVDVVPGAASSMYFYFDPDESRRSLGTYSALQEIDFCRRTGRTWLYLGFYVAGCRAMSYKARFGPHEILSPVRGWVLEQAPTGADGSGDPPLPT